MTRLLQRAFEELERLAPDMQDEIARALLGLAGDSADDLDAEDHAAIEEGRAQAARGEFSPLSPEEAVRTAFRPHR